jgi:hypothetical protein
VTSEVPLLSRSHPMASTQPRLLGVCWMVYGVLRLAMTLWLLAFTTNATLMFGALLTRVPNPFSLMADFHFLYLGVIVWSAVSGVVGILAGVALLSGQRAARPLAIAAALLSLSELPFGIALGVYTLVVVIPATLAPPYSAASTRS